MKFWGWIAAVAAFGVGVGLGDHGARAIPREAEERRGAWGLVRAIERRGDEPKYRENVQITFADRSRTEGLVVRGYAHTDAQGIYPRDQAAPTGAKLRAASSSGYDFAEVTPDDASTGRVDFLGFGRPHEIDLRPATGQPPEHGVMVTPIGSETSLWFGRDYPVRLHSGSYDVVLHDLAGPIGSTRVVCYGESSAREVPIPSQLTEKLTVQVGASAMPSGLVVKALRLPEEGPVPPAEVLARSGVVLQPKPGDRATGPATEFEATLATGRYLVGADDGRALFLGAQEVRLTAGAGAEVALVLTQSGSEPLLEFELQTPNGAEIDAPRFQFRGWVNGESISRAVSVRRTDRGTYQLLWPQSWADSWSLGLGNPEVTITSAGRHDVTVTPESAANLGVVQRVVLPGRATLEVRVPRGESESLLDGCSLYATLEPPETDPSGEPSGDVSGRDEIVPLYAKGGDANSGVRTARFEDTIEGKHRVVIRVRDGRESDSGVKIAEADVDLALGENHVTVAVPSLGRLELDLHDLPSGAVVVVERLLRGPTHERVTERRFEAEPIEIRPLPFDDYLIHLHREDGRFRTSRWIRVDAAKVAAWIDDRRPNALLVLPLADSPVAEAGFQWGDVIVEIGGEPIRSERLRALLLGLEEGAVPCRVQRGDETIELALDFEEAVDTDEGRPELRPIRWSGR